MCVCVALGCASDTAGRACRWQVPLGCYPRSDGSSCERVKERGPLAARHRYPHTRRRLKDTQDPAASPNETEYKSQREHARASLK